MDECFEEFGVDSLGAIEIRNALEALLRAESDETLEILSPTRLLQQYTPLLFSSVSWGCLQQFFAYLAELLRNVLALSGTATRAR